MSVQEYQRKLWSVISDEHKRLDPEYKRLRLTIDGENVNSKLLDN